MKQFNLVNDQIKKRFQAKKRNYIIIIGTDTHDVNEFKISEIFEKSYRNEIVSSNNLAKVKDYVSLRNALIMISALKQERVFREVYLLKDS